jgi:hypothetical protein
VALFEDFDFKAALEKAKKMKAEAQEDLLLKNSADEVLLQAQLLVYEI